MNKTLLVLRYELISVILRRSFLMALILVPLGSFLIMLVVSALQRSQASQVVSEVFSGTPAEAEVQGFVDQSGVIQTIPAEVQSRLQQFDDISHAELALMDGDIAAYYIVSESYLETGQVEYIRPDFNPLGGFEQSGAMQTTLNFNLLKDYPQLIESIQSPMNLQVDYLETLPQRESSSALTFFLPYAVTLLFYITTMSSASLMLSNITSEKQNRVMEILMTSIRPVEMLTGKIIALGLAGLLQTVVWGTAGILLLRLSGRTLNLSAAFQLPVTILLWGIVFFILGYGLYASLMAGVGALVPNLREASQATTVVIIPLIVPLMMINTLIQNPDGGLSIFLSLFPLTAPISMMTRMAATQVPIWQPLLAAALLVVMDALVVRSVAGMFRAQNLLSGSPFSIKVFLKALAGRA